MKKGFTLIELLAVIVILAIIAVIATPIVLNIISETKESASFRSAEFYLDSVNYAIANRVLEHGNIPDNEYPIMSDGNICLGNYFNEICDSDILDVQVKGNAPNEGIIYITSNQVSKIINLKIEQNVFALNDSGLVISSGNYSVWDGKSSTKTENLKIDAKEKIVQVNSASDLAGVRDAINEGNLVGYKIILNTSIDLNNKLWEPIGKGATYSKYTEGDKYFVGSLIGNGYTITGLNVVEENSSKDVGLFGAVGGNVLIENLNLQGKVTSNGNTAGGLIGFAIDNNTEITNVLIKNVVLDVNVEASDSSAVIIGRAYNTGETNIINSTSNGTIASQGKGAGIIAMHAYGTLKIENCKNNANINSGKILGGILGYASFGQNLLLKNIINNSNVILNLNNGSAGGIIGNAYEQSYDTKHTGTIENVINNGNISATGTNSFIGGLVGSLAGEWLLENNINNGNVNTETSNTVGGIIGIGYANITINTNVNNGNLATTGSLGGMIGRYEVQNSFSQYANYSVNINNCLVKSPSLINTTSTNVGGVIGWENIKTALKDLTNVTITNSSVEGFKDVGLVHYN